MSRSSLPAPLTFTEALGAFSSRLARLQVESLSMGADDRDGALAALHAVSVLASRCPVNLDDLRLPGILTVMRAWLESGAPDQMAEAVEPTELQVGQRYLIYQVCDEGVEIEVGRVLSLSREDGVPVLAMLDNGGSEPFELDLCADDEFIPL